MNNIMTTVELNDILARIMKSDSIPPYEQKPTARYWWVRYCEENKIWPDTKDYDELILCIWSTYFGKLNTQDSWFKNFEEFDMYMCEPLV